MSFNVLQLTNSFQQGGSERQAVQLARLLQASGRCRVHLAALDASGALLEDARSVAAGDVAAFPLTSFYDLNAARQLRQLATYLREREIAVVHTHDFYTNVFGMAAALLARTPARVASKRETGGMRTRAQEIVERQAFRLAHAVVVNAEAVARQLASEGVPAGKTVVVHNGLDMNRVALPANWRREDALAALGLPVEGGHHFVSIVANLQHEVKDHPTFLRAAARVKASMPDAAFVLAGEGRLMESLRGFAAQLGIGDRVFFTGRCSRVADLLAVSDVCVLSSKAEGFSNSILEYMAAGRAVVATDVGGAREAVVEGETGHLVEAGDEEALAARIISLLGDPARARVMGEAGRRIIEQKFSCEAQLKSTLKLYEGLLKRAHRAEFRAVEDARQKSV